ncbi:MAG: hypothetical protein GXC76_13010 [Rhodanobacteraceae bacterium]|jgi:hypothetical protein|nr:hypothetical protein [Rhodanobacteraceae bacterium]
MSSPQEVVWAIEFALSRDVDASRPLLKHYPEGMRELGEEVLAAKERLLAALKAFLQAHPART